MSALAPLSWLKLAQFLQAVVVALSGEMINGVPQELHVAALPGSAGQAFRDRLSQRLVVIRDHELDPVETALLQPHPHSRTRAGASSYPRKADNIRAPTPLTPK